MSLIRGIKDYRLLHEATLCMKKSHWRKYKYQESSEGEGCGIFGKASKCEETMIEYCMVCVVWDKNTVNKDIYTKDAINVKLDEISLKLLKKIYGTSNMENIESGDSQNNASVSTVEIPLQLLNMSVWLQYQH